MLLYGVDILVITMQPEKQLVNKTALFVLGSYTMGGIQSNFTRLLPYLVEKGLKVRVLVITDKVEESFLPLLSNVELLFYRDYLPLRMLGLNSSAILHSCPLVNKDLISCLADTQYIHAVDSETMILSSRIAAKLGVPLSVGCYHPREFTWEADDYYFRKAQHEMYQRLPPQNRVFFNEEVLAATSGFHKSSDFTGCVIPLTINCMEPAIKSITSKKIVSIGRLVKFKSYNEHMIKCLDVINDTYGMDFEYHIYGDGPNREYLEGLAGEIRSEVVFHGTVPYSQFQCVLDEAFLFVGCGSALLEAAAAGVPCMYGVDSIESPLTYGHFHDVPGTNLGERDSDLKLCTYLEFFGCFLDGMDFEKYCLISDKEMQKAAENSLDKVSTKWIECLSKSLVVNAKYSTTRYAFSNVVWLFLNYIGFRCDRNQRY